MKRQSLCIRTTLLIAVTLMIACDLNTTSWKQANMTPMSPRLQSLLENTRTVCFGRFVIDVPESAEIIWGPVSVPWRVAIYSDGMTTVSKMAADNVARLKAERNLVHDKPSFISEEEMLDPPGKIVTGYANFQATGAVSIDAYFALPPYGVHVKSGDFLEDSLETAPRLREMAQRLRTRQENEVPDEPGQCIEYAFLPDKPGPAKAKSDSEHVRIGFRLKEFPDAHLSIYVAPANRYNPQGDSLESQLSDSEKDAFKAGKANPFAALKVFRRDKREIHDWKTGFEILTRTPDEPGSHAHQDFWMKFTGVSNDPLRPYADIQFKTGVDKNSAGAVKPSLTDEEAIALWDKLTSSIRVRPTGGAAKTSATTPPRDAPLGELAATGRTCPQTGWWECIDVSRPLESDHRRFLHAGERMPHVLVAGQPSVWQKLKNEKPIYRSATVWRLVDYEMPEPAAALPQPAAAAAEDAGTARDTTGPGAAGTGSPRADSGAPPEQI